MVCRIVAVERDESTAEALQSEALQSFFSYWDGTVEPLAIRRLFPLRSIRLEPPAWPSAEAVAAVEEEMQAESAEAFLKLCEGN
ncbi:uncharacterized protein METZ01_LOCUS251141 [marine metagenome]|uniref:Uncharacterized protein n=1 Tax=marine metagenome TaxID=408172 RepID=A0A382IGC5_9ZZZZ